MVILQGDLFWIDFGEPTNSGPGYLRPCVVIQNDAYNRSKIRTVIVCILTTNLKLGQAPGNITLYKDEGNLPKKSVVNVSQVYTVGKSDLKEKIGMLPKDRVQEILARVKDIIEPSDLID